MKYVEDYKDFVKSVFGRYHSVSDKSIDSLLRIAKIQKLKKGDYLLNIGDVSKQSHILFKGAVVSCFLNKEGHMYHKNIFLEGDFVGSKVSTLTTSPSRFALEAIEDSVLLSYNYKTYRELIDKHIDLKD